MTWRGSPWRLTGPGSPDWTASSRAPHWLSLQMVATQRRHDTRDPPIGIVPGHLPWRIASAHSGYSRASPLAVSPGRRLSLRELPALHLAWVKVGDKDALQHVPVLRMSPDPASKTRATSCIIATVFCLLSSSAGAGISSWTCTSQSFPSNHRVTGIDAAPVCTASAAGPPSCGPSRRRSSPRHPRR